MLWEMLANVVGSINWYKNSVIENLVIAFKIFSEFSIRPSNTLLGIYPTNIIFEHMCKDVYTSIVRKAVLIA